MQPAGLIRLLCAGLTLLLIDGQVLAQPGGRLRPPPAPPENPVTQPKADLGMVLFWDEQLSSTMTVACATCHTPTKGGTDARSTLGDILTTNPGPDGRFGTPDDITGSMGVPFSNADGFYLRDPVFGFDAQVGSRKAPAAINAGYSRNLFWDGRAVEEFRDPLSNAVIIRRGGALESQATAPPVGTAEMAHDGRDWSDVAARLQRVVPLALAEDLPGDLESWIGNRMYSDLFSEAFGSPDITPARILMAIATYERTLFTDQTPFDDFLDGTRQLQPMEQQGLQLFNQFQCNGCHTGPLLSDDLFHYIGVRPVGEDLGRFLVSNDPRDRGSFRTPSLRNVELRAPYFHNGRMRTLEDVVDFYNRGGDFNAPNKDPRIRPLNMNPQQRQALLAFLRRPLTDQRVVNEQPPFDHPTLYAQSDRRPIEVGVGRAGSGGFVPRIIAIEPPLLGNESFTVAVDRGLGGAVAYFVMDRIDPLKSLAARPFATVPIGLVSDVIALDGSGPGNGGGSVVWSIPRERILEGEAFLGRCFVEDPGAAGGWSWSAAVRVEFFR